MPAVPKWNSAVMGRTCRGCKEGSCFGICCRLRGSDDVQVTLTVRPHGKDSTKQLTLKREKINFNPVSSQLCGSVSSSAAPDADSGVTSSKASSKVGYIRVATFSKQTPGNARNAIQKLKSEGADRCGSLHQSRRNLLIGRMYACCLFLCNGTQFFKCMPLGPPRMFYHAIFAHAWVMKHLSGSRHGICGDLCAGLCWM